MTAPPQVRAVIDVKSEDFHQVIEEPVGTEQSASYEQLIAANERLKSDISKIFTEFVNKARQEQETNGVQKKRQIKDDDDEDGNEEDEEEPEPSDNEEEQ